jgi:hypothetical protein
MSIFRTGIVWGSFVLLGWVASTGNIQLMRGTLILLAILMPFLLVAWFEYLDRP